MPVAAVMCLCTVSHLLGVPSAVPGSTEGCTGLCRAKPGGSGAGGTGCNLPPRPHQAQTRLRFQSLLLTLSQTEARRKAPAALAGPGAPGNRSSGGLAAVSPHLPGPGPPHRPPASSTGASTAQTLGYKATLPNTHRGAPPGRERGCGMGPGAAPATPGSGRGARSCPAPPAAER